MQQNWKFQRGDIFFTHFGASTGSEQHGDRPAVILQNDVGNYHSPTLIVATMTSKAEKKVNQPTHCLLENAGLNMPSVVQAEQIFTIDKSRALKYLGHLTPEEMRRVDDAVRIKKQFQRDFLPAHFVARFIIFLFEILVKGMKLPRFF